MSNSTIFSGSGADDNADGFAIVTEVERNNAIIALDDDTPSSALPVVVEGEDDDEDEYRREAIDLDDIGGGNGRQPLDLGSLIGQLGARRPKPQQPSPVPNTATSPSTPQGPSLEEQLQSMKVELERERNNTRRAMADLINYRRKAEVDKERAVQDAVERFARRLLEVMDDFERSLRTTSDSKSYDKLADGVSMILRNYDTMLAVYGISPVDTTGNLFDVELHEAVGTDQESDLPDDTIVEELRRGYTIDGRLLRAAMVKVARKPDEIVSAAVTEHQSSIESNGEPIDSGTEVQISGPTDAQTAESEVE